MLSGEENNAPVFTSPENFKNDYVEIKGAELHHLSHVLRLGEGGIIEVLDGRASVVA